VSRQRAAAGSLFNWCGAISTQLRPERCSRNATGKPHRAYFDPKYWRAYFRIVRHFGYNDEMIVRTAPAALTSLHFRVSFYPKKTSPRDFSFSVIAPNGLSIVQAEGQLSAELNYDVQSVVNIASKPLLLPEHGAYSMRFGLGKKENEVDVGRFMVRKPANDEENNRLPK